MIVIEFTVSKQNITLAQEPDVIASGSCKFIQFKFTFSAEWDGLDKIAKINTGGVEYQAPIEDDGTVSPENMPILQAGYCYIGVVGTKTDGAAATTVLLQNPLLVKQGADSGGEIVVIEQTYGQQVLAAAEAAALSASTAEDAATAAAASAATAATDAASAALTSALGAVSTHNQSAESHTDIRDDIRAVEAIARGRATGYVFDLYADMVAWLAVPENVAGLVVGDNLYIRDVGVKDYWWDGTAAQELEAECPDLTGYYTKTQVDALIPILITRTDYDALVAAGTVIADRTYDIIEGL